ncbi:aspartate aminotransferase family protein [Nonomuraea angiospora]|uniref:Putrescine aminotransferase n=2 Tax=Nonomuraea angiospora TaxID=46172 RepID=A0ABR9LNN9_9ACTN|nr:putrescine aminotransferase [Nonomuraea angiospora]
MHTTAAPSATARMAFTHMKRHLPPKQALSGRLTGNGAVEVGASGCHVELSDGRSALDFGSYAVTILGHRHPDVLEAVHRQLDLMPTATRLLTNPVTAAAAAALAAYLGGALNRVFFGANGADAVEAAIKLARLASGRDRIVAVQGGFHGKSLGALALTHHERFRGGLHDVLAPVVHVSPDDPDAVARECAAGDVAALVFEPLQGENGVRPLDGEVVRAWCAAAADHDTFVVADEIQTGLRRCGERSLALVTGLPVDAVLLGKSLGGGVLPLSAAVCSERLYAPLLADPTVHSTTFSGHPLACAALPVALEAIEASAVQGRVVAAAMERGLARIRHEHAHLVEEVRGRGLLWGLDLPSEDLTAKLIVRLAHAGLLVSPCMSRPATLRLMPPMVAGVAEVEQALEILSSVLSELPAHPGAKT